MRRFDEYLLGRLYDYIIEYQKDTGKSPTYRDIMNGIPSGFSSTAKVKGYLSVLRGRGLIDIERNGSIAVDSRLRSTAVNAQLVGSVACGQPIEAIENIEGSYALSPEIFGSGELMLLRATGNSMTEVGIDNGDLIVIRRQQEARYGDMVLALIGDSATVKTFYPQADGKIVLHPENEDMEDILVRDCEIQGKVVGCIKTYR